MEAEEDVDEDVNADVDADVDVDVDEPTLGETPFPTDDST